MKKNNRRVSTPEEPYDEKTIVEQYGLQLPNGLILWDGYHNYPFTTPEERATMLEVLRKTAEQCGFVEEAFLKGYNWHRRQVTTIVRYDPGVLPVASPSVTERQDDNNGDTDASATPSNDPSHG